VAWAQARFDQPDHCALHAEAHRQIERDPAFALLLHKAYERRAGAAGM